MRPRGMLGQQGATPKAHATTASMHHLGQWAAGFAAARARPDQMGPSAQIKAAIYKCTHTQTHTYGDEGRARFL